MPDVDLRPDNYRVQDRRGRWQIPEDPKVYVVGLIIFAALTGTIFIRRNEIGLDDVTVMLAFVGMVSFFGGMAFALLLQFIARRGR